MYFEEREKVFHVYLIIGHPVALAKPISQICSLDRFSKQYEANIEPMQFKLHFYRCLGNI